MREQGVMWKCTTADSVSRPTPGHGTTLGDDPVRTSSRDSAGRTTERKILVQIRDTAPAVEIRPLAAYESAAIGGGR